MKKGLRIAPAALAPFLWYFGAVTGASAAARLQQPVAGPTTAAPESEHRALLDKYCVTCHNERLHTAGLALDKLDASNPSANAEVWEKVIAKLEQGRAQSVRLMDDLARCVPDHLWLTGASQDSPGSLSVEGVTFSNLVVSDFMSRLEHSSLFAGVELEYAERSQFGDHDVVKFRLTCRVTPDEPAN